MVAVQSAMSSEPVRTFSIGFEESEFSELRYARQVARQFGTIHTEQVITPDAVKILDDLAYYYDEPFADSSAIPTMYVSRLAPEREGSDLRRRRRRGPGRLSALRP